MKKIVFFGPNFKIIGQLKYFINARKECLLVLIIVLIINCFHTKSQSYFTALGLRFGSEYGLTLQQKIWKKSTIEAILQRTDINKETLLTVLFEKHNRIISKRLNLYLGAGIHTGIEKLPEETKSKNLFGVTGIAGLEFTMARVNISVDVKPAYHTTHGRFSWDKAISARYVLIKSKKKKLFGKKKKKDETFWEKTGIKKKEEKPTFWEKIGIKKKKEEKKPAKPWWKFWENKEKQEEN